MIVMKFGGSSVASATAIQRVVSIVKDSLQDRPVVVVSAMGKTTDRLLRAGELAAGGDAGAGLRELRELETFHQAQGRLLGVDVNQPVAELFDSAVVVLARIAASATLSAADCDALLSFGERLSSVMVAAALEAGGVPSLHLRAETLILTDKVHAKAAPLYWETYAKLRRAIPAHGRVAVMGGFIGAAENGAPTTLGRGGSDFTAALVGAALNAEEVQIWTDVDGMLSCDPRVLKGGRCLRQISYLEASEMAEWGAKVLHPATVAPAMRQRVPVSIRNSGNATHPGTRIESGTPSRGDGLVKSVACHQRAALVRVFPLEGPLTQQFATLVRSLFASHRVDFLAMNGKDAVEAAACEQDGLAALLEALARVGRVETESGLAVVSLIGRAIGETRGMAGGAVRILAKRSIPFHAMGTAPMRISFMVARQELPAAVEGLHEEFVKFQECGHFHREFAVRGVPARAITASPRAFAFPRP